MPKSTATSKPAAPASPTPPTVAVLGLGQMGLVCASVLSEREGGAKGKKGASRAGAEIPPRARVVMWGHSAEEAGALMQTRSSPRLSGFRLPDEVRIAVKDKDAVGAADLIVSAVPVQFSRQVWERLRRYVPEGCPVVSVAKGIENTTLLRPTEIIAAALGDEGKDRALGCLSGPTIAPELAKCLPATMVAASEDAALARRVQELFTTRWLRVYTHNDLVGVEVAGATKNVIAIAAGVLDGLHAGNNAKSALLARGLAEIARLGAALGAKGDTFFGVAGVGDLATSCFSPEGRNRSLGEALGRGQTLEEALRRSRHVVEGVATARSVMDLARRHKVEMPIAGAVFAILFEGLDPIEAIGGLMSRAPKAERVG